MSLGRLALVLLYVVQIQCQAPPPQGIEFIGAGYNILTGNPHGTRPAEGGLDPGILPEQRILALTYDEGYDDGTYLRPDQVQYNLVGSCSFVKTDYVFWGSESWQRNVEGDVLRIGGTSHSVGKEFSLSEIFGIVYDTTVNIGDVCYEERFLCDRGSARYQTENVETLEYPLENGFAQAVCALPTAYDENTYMNFIDTWGTDIIVGVNVGTERSDIYNTARPDFCFYAYESFGSTVSYGGSYNGYKDSVVVNMNSFENQVSTRFGALLAAVETGDSELNEPISLRLISIDEALGTGYWRQFCQYVVDGSCQLQDLADLGTRQTNVVTALQGYAAWKKAPSPANAVVQTAVTWPTGIYGFPQPNVNCPFSSGFNWNTGWRFHDTEDVSADNNWSNPYDLKGPVGDNNMYQNFCMKTISTATSYDWKWPTGEYCIFRRGGSCPQGFSSGWIYWDDEDIFNANERSGTLPDGTYDDDTLIYYCCRQDGPASKTFYLPTDWPFVLIKRTTSCPNVYGMSVSHQWFFWDCEDIRPATDKGGFHPYENGGSDNHRLHYCYYY